MNVGKLATSEWTRNERMMGKTISESSRRQDKDARRWTDECKDDRTDESRQDKKGLAEVKNHSTWAQQSTIITCLNCLPTEAC